MRAMIGLSERAVSVLQEGRQAHLAVASSNGPHVTPELFAWSGGRLWFASAAGTVKANVVQREPSVGAVVRVPGRSLLLAGTVDRFDVLDPLGLVRRAGLLPGAVHALTGYAVRNAPDLVAFGRDAFRGRLGWRPPPRRVLFGLSPDRWLLLENEVVVDASGSWASLAQDAAPVDAGAGDDVEGLPPGGQPAVVALPGPIALPGRWFDDVAQVAVPVVLQDLLPTGEVPVGVVVDDYRAPGPAAKRGALVRGTAHAVADRPGVLVVEADRAVEWDGVATTTVEA